MRHYGLDPEDPTSWLYLENGRAFSLLDGGIRVGVRLGGVWRVVAVLRLLPRPLRDALYRFVARNRYRFSGRWICAACRIQRFSAGCLSETWGAVHAETRGM